MEVKGPRVQGVEESSEMIMTLTNPGKQTLVH